MKTETRNNQEIQVIWDRLNSAKGLVGIELLFAKSRTQKLLKDVVESFAMDTVIPESEDFKAYAKELTEAYQKLATKDGIVQTKTIKIPTGPETFKETSILDLDLHELKVIRVREAIEKKYKATIDARKEDEKKYREHMLKGTTEVSIFYFPVKYAPTNQEQFDAVQDLIYPMSTEMEEKWDALFAEMMEIKNS